jgi:hypothetical protein
MGLGTASELKSGWMRAKSGGLAGFGRDGLGRVDGLDEMGWI